MSTFCMALLSMMVAVAVPQEPEEDAAAQKPPPQVSQAEEAMEAKEAAVWKNKAGLGSLKWGTGLKSAPEERCSCRC